MSDERSPRAADVTCCASHDGTTSLPSSSTDTPATIRSRFSLVMWWWKFIGILARLPEQDEDWHPRVIGQPSAARISPVDAMGSDDASTKSSSSRGARRSSSRRVRCGGELDPPATAALVLDDDHHVQRHGRSSPAKSAVQLEPHPLTSPGAVRLLYFQEGEGQQGEGVLQWVLYMRLYPAGPLVPPRSTARSRRRARP